MLAAGCGGGGGGSSSGSTLPAAVVSVSVSPIVVSVPTQSSQQFTATVSNASNTAVSWQVNGVAGGNSTVGSISNSGLYTAPVVVPQSGTVTVVAVSQANTNTSSSAQVTITSGALTVVVTPSTTSVPLGCTQQFAATVSGPLYPTGVLWRVNDIASGNSQVGTITTTGLYTPPAAVPASNPVTVTAISGADLAKSGSASANIIPASACLTSLSPIVTMQGSGALTLAVNGSAFSSASQVLFNGAARPTTFVGPTDLSVTLDAADLVSPGVFPVAVQTGTAISNSAKFYVVLAIQSQLVTVTAGGAESDNVDIDVPQHFPLTLSLLGVGFANPAGVVGVEVPQGSSASLLLVGNGVQPGTFYVISGNPSDVTVTQPVVSDFTSTAGGFPAVRVQITVSPSAALGPRNILVTNPVGEISVLVGALLITP